MRVPLQLFRMFQTSGKAVSLLGVPFSGGQPKGGVEDAPRLLRQLGLVNRIKDLGWSVVDSGDVMIPVVSQRVQPNNPVVKNAVECGTVAQKVAQVLIREAQKDNICVTVGGDHSISVGTIFGHAAVRRDLCVLWVDAHTDINTPGTSISGNIHGMAMGLLMKGAPSFPKLSGYEWLTPCLSPKDLAYIGLRDVEDQEREIIEKLGITAFTVDDIDKYGLDEVLNRAFDHINPRGDRPMHVSYDIDSLDPKEAPSTGTPVRGGLIMDEGIYIAGAVANTGWLAGLDMVEVNPHLGSEDDSNKTIENAVTLIEVFLGNEHPATLTVPVVETGNSTTNA